MAKQDMQTRCNVFKTHRGYLARFSAGIADSTAAAKKQNVLPTPILIVDVSGSMDKHAARLVNNLLPQTLQQIGYPVATPLHLLTFQNYVTHTQLALKDLASVKVTQGGTRMAQVPVHLKNALTSATAPAYLIVTVSDGEVWDQNETVENAAKLAKELKSLHLTIASYAIRFGTGGAPDTRALSSLMQLDNTGLKVSLEDVEASLQDDDIVGIMVKMLADSNGLALASLDVEGAKIRKFPWEREGSGSLAVRAGASTTFWLDAVPAAMKLDGVPIAIDVTDTFMDRRTYITMLETTIAGILQRARVLKVVGQDSSHEEISRMMTYFDELERSWLYMELDAEVASAGEDPDATPLQVRSLILKRTIEKSAMSVRNQLSTIMNDSRVAQMNSMQQADYLRKVDLNKTTKGLAKRGAVAEGGFDFDATTRSEVKAMHAHLHELDGVDDSMHMESFYSRGTTMEGIRAVCGLVGSGIIDQVTTSQVLELFNVVGVPCDATVGDYPDPMTYRVHKILPDCTISLADVLTNSLASGGEDLTTPFTRQNIVNVIPVFEDARTPKFLRKHAPSLTEYLASVGMRRVVVQVPMTMGYTVLAGMWNMLELLNTNASARNVRIFLHLVTELPFTVGGYFKHTLPLLDHANHDPDLAFHTLHNGVTNMIVAMLFGIKHKKQFDMPKLLRALYSFEVWQAVRKRYRHAPESEIDKMIHKLFAVDFEKWRIPVSPLFETDPEPETIAKLDWPSKMAQEYLADMWRDCWYVDFLTFIPALFQVAVDTEATTEAKEVRIKDMMPFSEEDKARALGVADLGEFRRTSLLQALAFTTKRSRISEETELPLLPDPGSQKATAALTTHTLREVYLKQYAADRKVKLDEEDAILHAALRDALVAAPDVDAFIALMRSGITRGARSMLLTHPSDPVFKTVAPALFAANPPTPIPCHAQKLAILICGGTLKGAAGTVATDAAAAGAGTAVWNNGNMLQPFRKLEWYATFKALGAGDALWRAVNEIRRSRIHKYRVKGQNRHSHSNEKPSYWAMGFASMAEMRANVDDYGWDEYVRVHADCCGCHGGVYLGDLTIIQ